MISPFDPMRSLSPRRYRREASGTGFCHARSNIVGVRMRPISSMSRKPDVVSTPVNAPDFCKIVRSEENTSELQSLMRISYAVFCLKKKKKRLTHKKVNEKTIYQ